MDVVISVLLNLDGLAQVLHLFVPLFVEMAREYLQKYVTMEIMIHFQNVLMIVLEMLLDGLVQVGPQRRLQLVRRFAEIAFSQFQNNVMIITSFQGMDAAHYAKSKQDTHV